MFSLENKNIKEDAECQFFWGKMSNKEVFKKGTKKSRKLIHKIHINPSRTAKGHKNGYDKSLEGENSLKNTDSETSKKEGIDLGEAEVIWRKLAKCESQIEMMGKLVRNGVGFNEVEAFAVKMDRKLVYKSRDRNKVRDAEEKKRKLVKLSMSIKLGDERRRHAELLKKKIGMRKELFQKCGENKSKMKKIMKRLRRTANEEKKKCRMKNENKIKHLVKRKNLREQNYGENWGWEGEGGVPDEIIEMREVRAFNEEEFEKIEVKETEPCRIGNVELDRNEEEALRLHPKFAVRKKLDEEQFELDIECGFAKLRWEIGENNLEKKEEQIAGVVTIDIESRENKSKEQEEELTKGELVFDPVKKVYDARNMKVTNLGENTRITLPKPLKPVQEAMIEVRREEYMRVFREYKEQERKKGERRTNLTEMESKGIKSLKKRIENDEIVVIKTDKSSKMAVMNKEEYKSMGESTRVKDRKIGREGLIRREKVLNEHTEFWTQMTKAGENHEHNRRIVKSRTSNSNNTANLYFMFKDHKKEVKFRDVASGSTSNTLGLSNVISELVEAISASASENYEVISGEDMIANIEKVNTEFEAERTRVYGTEVTNIETERGGGGGGEIGELVGHGGGQGGEQVDPGNRNVEMKEINYERLYMIGFDAVALYPSMSAKNTARICKEQAVDIMSKGNINVEGLDMRKVTLYVRINKNKTGDLSKLWGLLPFRKKVGGVEPGMSSKGVKGGEPEEQWSWPRREPTKQEKIELVGRMIEIGIRVLFENLVYSFGGEDYIQTEGGPIGVRGTGAVAKLVTRDFCMKLKNILERGRVEVKMLKMYVDDGRLVTTGVQRGAVYNTENKEIEYTTEQEEADRNREVEGETMEQRIKRLILPVMNDLNKDLEWTVELETDFAEGKGIPTLDFSVYWEVERGRFEYTYFEKQMKNPVVIQKRSAMGRNQKYQILSNELVRRMGNISMGGKNETEEKIRVVEEYTVQLKTSGYNYKETQEIIRSGCIGFKRRKERRTREGIPYHREGYRTLEGRVKKKLMDKKSWYKRKVVEEEKVKPDTRTRKARENIGRTSRGKEKGAENREETDGRTVEIKSIIFVQETKNSGLIKKLRETEEKMAATSGYRIKFVERCGDKMVDILTQSNPWKGKDCEREGCMICITRTETGKGMRQSCSSRNVTYETWCSNCEEEEERKKEEETEKEWDEKATKGVEKKGRKQIRLFKYIGETGRSGFERNREHCRDREKWKISSHMLKHIVEHHGGEEEEKVKFKMKILRTHRSSFERQVYEGIRIQRERKEHNILNSKSEFNRCALPRLEVKFEGAETGKKSKQQLEDEKRELELERKIRKMGLQRKKGKNMGEDGRNKCDEGGIDKVGGVGNREGEDKKSEDRVRDAVEGEALGEDGIRWIEEIPSSKSWDGRQGELIEGDRNRRGGVYDVKSDEKIDQGGKMTEEKREKMTKNEKTRPIDLENCYSIEMTVGKRDKPVDSEGIDRNNKDCKIPDRNAVKEEGEVPEKREVEDRAVGAKVRSKTVEEAGRKGVKDNRMEDEKERERRFEIIRIKKKRFEEMKEKSPKLGKKAEVEDGIKGEDSFEKGEGKNISMWRRRGKLNQYEKMLERKEGWRREEKHDSDQEEDNWEEAEGRELEKEYVGGEEEFIEKLIVEMENNIWEDKNEPKEGEISVTKRKRTLSAEEEEDLVREVKKIRLDCEGEMVEVNRGEGAGGVGDEVVKKGEPSINHPGNPKSENPLPPPGNQKKRDELDKKLEKKSVKSQGLMKYGVEGEAKLEFEVIKKRKRTEKEERRQGGTPKMRVVEEKEHIVNLKTPKMKKVIEKSKGMTPKNQKMVEKIVKSKDVNTPSIKKFFKKSEQTGKNSIYEEKKLELLEGGNSNLLEEDGCKWWSKCNNTGSAVTEYSSSSESTTCGGGQRNQNTDSQGYTQSYGESSIELVGQDQNRFEGGKTVQNSCVTINGAGEETGTI